jgi:hypothetical protein
VNADELVNTKKHRDGIARNPLPLGDSMRKDKSLGLVFGLD